MHKKKKNDVNYSNSRPFDHLTATDIRSVRIDETKDQETC